MKYRNFQEIISFENIKLHKNASHLSLKYIFNLLEYVHQSI